MNPEILNQLFEIVLIPLFGAITVFIVKWLNAKAEQIKIDTDNTTLDKYLDMLSKTITKCVIATNQTYVETLKEQNAFDEAAQKIAFEKTYEAVMAILSVEVIDYLTEVVGDFETFLMESIEAEVNLSK